MHAQTKAFPTAEGFGCMSQGGRGGQVVEVTNATDDATSPSEGSLRWALQQYPNEPLTVVFRTSGLIDLKAELRCKRNYLTIAGQTAPGDGICIKGNKVNFGGSTHLVIRHIRFRIGVMLKADGTPDASGKGSIGIENASNFIIDHCTFGWSAEENMTIYDNVNTTIQWCILHEGLYNSGHNKGVRSYGSQWGGQSATYHHNLLAHNYNRSPRFNGARSNDVNVLIDYVNNVNYNWGKENSCYGGDIENSTHTANFVNNYYKPGAARQGSNSSYFVQSSFSSSQSTSKIAKWYLNGNIIEGSANTAKNTDNFLGLDASAYISKGVSASALKSVVPFEVAYPVTTQTATEAYQSVLAGAGAFPRDTVDRRIVNEVRTGTVSGKGTVQYYYSGGTQYTSSLYNQTKGIIDDPDAVGGYPAYSTYNVVTDADHDGMDDVWELANGLNPSDPADRNLLTSSGYTVLEVYLNSLVGETIPLTIISAVKDAKVDTLNIEDRGNMLYITSDKYPVKQMRIVNVSGKTVWSKKGTEISNVDISHLPFGVYMAEAVNEGNFKMTQKFTIHKK
jgi:pectate lyase